MLNTHLQLLLNVRMSGTIPSVCHTPSPWRVEEHFNLHQYSILEYHQGLQPLANLRPGFNSYQEQFSHYTFEISEPTFLYFHIRS